MPSHPTRYVVDLTENDKIFVRFRTEKGKIISFTIQYSTKSEQRWRTVRRYDTAHNKAHIDVYNFKRRGKIQQIPLEGEYNEIFTYALRNVKREYYKMKEYFYS